MTALDKAVKIFGNQRKLAFALGIKPSSLNRWITKHNGRVPYKHLSLIYELTGVTPHELRPDIHPTPNSGLRG